MITDVLEEKESCKDIIIKIVDSYEKNFKALASDSHRKF